MVCDLELKVNEVYNSRYPQFDEFNLIERFSYGLRRISDNIRVVYSPSGFLDEHIEGIYLNDSQKGDAKRLFMEKYCGEIDMFDWFLAVSNSIFAVGFLFISSLSKSNSSLLESVYAGTIDVSKVVGSVFAYGGLFCAGIGASLMSGIIAKHRLKSYLGDTNG